MPYVRNNSQPYRDFEISPVAFAPMTGRDEMAWQFAHVDFDPDSINEDRFGYGPTVEDCKRQIDNWHDDIDARLAGLLKEVA